MNIYEVIGNKIQSSLNLFAGDIVVWLSLDGMSVTTLYRIDDGYGQWEDDWYEGQKDVRLIDYRLLDDLQPVTHAHWVEDSEVPWCSNCKGDILYTFIGEFDEWYSTYCPHCGAIMDEEVD